MPLGKLKRRIQERAAGDDRFRALAARAAQAIGYDLALVDRVAYLDHCHALLRELGPAGLDVCEISAGPNRQWRDFGFRSYRNLDWPEFDICDVPLAENLAGRFDLIIAEQVFEHLLYPYRAGRNVLSMLRPGGHVLLMTPFMVGLHSGPHDCTRWTAEGMRHFLAECGFPLEEVRSWSFGSRAAVRQGLYAWPRMGWKRELRNEPRYPLVVWAIARKPPLANGG